MRTLVRALLVLIVSCAGACGGKVAGDGSGATSSVPSPSEAEDPVSSSGPEEGEWGTWQLLSIDAPDGRRTYEPPFIELDLHWSGEAYLWTCALGLTGTGQRCPFYARQGCLVGTMSLFGDTWRVHFPTKEGTRTAARGDIADEPSGDITVKGEGVLPAGGHYRRVAAPSHEGCAP
jgi:hypothetical protein